jgi:hypothetical protein
MGKNIGFFPCLMAPFEVKLLKSPPQFLENRWLVAHLPEDLPGKTALNA